MASSEYLSEVEIQPDSQEVEIGIPEEITCETVETTIECDQQGELNILLCYTGNIRAAFITEFPIKIFPVFFCLQKPKM